MRVLIVVDHALGIDGPHRNVVGTLNALGARDDVQVALITGKVDPAEPYHSARNIEIHSGYDARSLPRAPLNLAMIRGSAKTADLIYVPSGLKSLLYANCASLGLGKPILAGPNVTHLPWRRADSPGDFEVARLCDVWLEASLKRRDHVRAHVSAALRERVCNLPHAIDLKKFAPQKRDTALWETLGVHAGCKVLYVGRDYELKGVSQLLDAFEGLDPAGFQLVLVGRMSEATLARARARTNIHPLGFKAGEELARIYASADLSVVPSSWENFPFVVLEGLASGLPVIASRTGGIPELITDGANGLLVDLVGEDGRHAPDAPAKLTAAISALAQDPERRTAMAAQARRSAEEKFSEARLGRDLLGIFSRLVAR